METGAGGCGDGVLAGLRRELDALWALDPSVLADGESLLGHGVTVSTDEVVMWDGKHH